MHSEEVHIEAGQGNKCSENVEKECQKYADDSISFEAYKVPIKLGDVCRGEVGLGRVETQQGQVHYEDPVWVKDNLYSKCSNEEGAKIR